MSSWKGKSRGTPLGYRIFIFLLKKGGLRPAYSLLKFVTCYYFLFSYQSSKELFNLYRKRLKLSVFKSLFLIYRNYYSLGQSIIDKIVITNNLPHKFTFDFDN